MVRGGNVGAILFVALGDPDVKLKCFYLCPICCEEWVGLHGAYRHGICPACGAVGIKAYHTQEVEDHHELTEDDLGIEARAEFDGDSEDLEDDEYPEELFEEDEDLFDDDEEDEECFDDDDDADPFPDDDLIEQERRRRLLDDEITETDWLDSSSDPDPFDLDGDGINDLLE